MGLLNYVEKMLSEVVFVANNGIYLPVIAPLLTAFLPEMFLFKKLVNL